MRPLFLFALLMYLLCAGTYAQDARLLRETIRNVDPVTGQPKEINSLQIYEYDARGNVVFHARRGINLERDELLIKTETFTQYDDADRQTKQVRLFWNGEGTEVAIQDTIRWTYDASGRATSYQFLRDVLTSGDRMGSRITYGYNGSGCEVWRSTQSWNDESRQFQQADSSIFLRGANCLQEGTLIYSFNQSGIPTLFFQNRIVYTYDSLGQTIREQEFRRDESTGDEFQYSETIITRDSTTITSNYQDVNGYQAKDSTVLDANGRRLYFKYWNTPQHLATNLLPLTESIYAYDAEGRTIFLARNEVWDDDLQIWLSQRRDSTLYAEDLITLQSAFEGRNQFGDLVNENKRITRIYLRCDGLGERVEYWVEDPILRLFQITTFNYDAGGPCPDQQGKQSITLYPNPTKSQFTVSMSRASEAGDQLRLIDLTGQVIMIRELGIAQEIMLTVPPNLVSGIYAVQLITASGSISQKLVLQAE